MKALSLTLLLFVALAQLAVPLRLAWRSETTLREGVAVRFPLVLRDPHDPMRGKFVRLNYNWGSFPLGDASPTAYPGERFPVCARVSVDEAGVATIAGVTLEPPAEGLWFRVEARPAHDGQVWLIPSFDRYFVNEHEAASAESAYREAARRPADPIAFPTACAVVRLWDGEAQLEDVLVEGRSLALVAREASEATPDPAE